MAREKPRNNYRLRIFLNYGQEKGQGRIMAKKVIIILIPIRDVVAYGGSESQ
jgi:hypothetical protein